MQNMFVPQKKTRLGYVKSLRFHGNPLYDFEEWGYT